MNVDKAMMNFLFGLDSNVSPFFFCVYMVELHEAEPVWKESAFSPRSRERKH